MTKHKIRRRDFLAALAAGTVARHGLWAASDVCRSQPHL